MDKRGAYFFVIDALIGGSIIFIGLILIFSSRVTKTESNPTLSLVNDFVTVISTTQIRSFQGAYVQSLLDDGNITDRDNTLLEQLTEFYWLNQSGIRDTTAIMDNYLKEISKTVIPDYRSISISLNNTRLYHTQSLLPEEAGLGVGTQKISFYRINTTHIYGPVLFEVEVWV
ncbi:hypothetical protein JXB28_05830 [Candidatus Woesearchaeota archaeon]|nr:hypothetical protein [Candidatus Woesearchaeota archaeon]